MDSNTIDMLISAAAPHSDMGPVRLRVVADQFVSAHQAVPGGVSIEIGTRAGGSALLQLGLIEHLYPDPGSRPLLCTVDPYGDKPYHMGGAFGPDCYVGAKRLLAPYPNHAHFLLESRVFLATLLGARYWINGCACVLDKIAFVLIDGEHTVESVQADVSALRLRMATGGVMLIDNFSHVQSAFPDATPLYPGNDMATVR